VRRRRAGRERGRQKPRSSRAPARARSKKVKVTRAQGRVAVSPGQVQSCRTVGSMRLGREQRCRRSVRSLPDPGRTSLGIPPPRPHGHTVADPPSWCRPHLRHRFRGRARRRPGRRTTALARSRCGPLGCTTDFVRNGTRLRGNTPDLHFSTPSRRGGAAEVGFLVAEPTTIPAFGPGLESRLRGFAAAAAGRRNCSEPATSLELAHRHHPAPDPSRDSSTPLSRGHPTPWHACHGE
jgi:hypothetical protein